MTIFVITILACYGRINTMISNCTIMLLPFLTFWTDFVNTPSV